MLPYIAPTAEKVKNAVEGYVGLLLTAVNASYMWFMWFTFMAMPEDARRFLVVCLGTVYPMLASVTAISTTPTKKNVDERFWLTYWATYNILFIMYVDDVNGEGRTYPADLMTV